MSRYRRAVRITSDKPPSPSLSVKRKITDAQVVELVWQNSTCVLNCRGKCPLVVFGKQLADALNAFFESED